MKILVANPCTLEVLRLNTEECVVSARSRSAVRRARGDEGSCALAGQGAIDLSPGLCFVTAWRQGESQEFCRIQTFSQVTIYISMD